MYSKQFMEAVNNPAIQDENKRKTLFKHYYKMLERQLSAQVQ
jgi:hypothetical protein